MKNFYILFIPLIFIFCLLVSCKKKDGATISESGKEEVLQSKFAKNYPEFSPLKLKEMLVQTKEDSVLNPLYTTTEHNPIWVHDTLDTKNLYEFISILNSAEEHGLSPESFSYSILKSLTDSIDSGVYANHSDTTLLYNKMLSLEKTATKSAIRYITGMTYGFTNPKALFGADYDITVSSPDSVFFSDLYSKIAQDPIKTIQDSHPTNKTYLKLQAEYKSLKEKEDTGLKKISVKEATYKLGSKNKHITEMAERLIQTGEYKPDSVFNDSIDYVLDEKLLKAINTFRRKISYSEEQEVGKLTIEALNRPLDYYMKKLSANMERYRWKRTKEIHKKHIEVNVAAAMLAASQSGKEPLIMRVCVGTLRNKTPLLQSDLGYLNLNPYWNVPKSIARDEVAVLQKRDSTYMSKRNMKLFKGGKEVPLSSINWKEVNPSTFSYIIRQEPGGGNSLGLIKFMFNNKFSVYLHDTPSKLAFTRNRRTVSHGCVRVQKPFDLAYYCLSPINDIYKDRLLYSVKREPMTSEGKKALKEGRLKKLPDIINLEADNKISLFIDYYTAFMYPEDDMLYYADDTYEYDNIILKSLL